MKIIPSVFYVLLCVAAWCCVDAFAQDASARAELQINHAAAPPPKPETNTERTNPTLNLSQEVEALKHRIEALESQNRAMSELLIELKSRLEKPAQPLTASNPREDRPASMLPAIHSEPHRAENPMRTAPTSAGTESPVTAQASPKTPETSANNSEPVRWSELIGEGNKIKLYGFLRLDLDIDSQRPNNDQTPLFITSADPPIGKPDAGSFSMHPRLSRFGVDWSGPRVSGLGEGKLSGKFEVDFENGGTESRQIIRIRHGYLKMDWNRLSILAGQTWDVVSPLFPTVNNDTLMWNTGNVGDRRPQFRMAYEPKTGKGQWSFIGAAGLTGAIDSQDLDANGYRDGEESGRPDVQARIGYARSLWVKDQRAGVGVSGFYGWMNTSRPVAGRTRFNSQLANIDYTLPLLSRLTLRGEGWWGRNLSDVRGAVGQGLNVVNGIEVRARGGWSEMNAKLSRYWSINPGFTIDDPVDRDLPTGGRTRNRAYYVANRFMPGGNFLIGVDYLRWITNYKGFLSGTDNRMNIFFQYNF